ncbi:hypothetical protein GPK64_13215 [Coprococcus eutactus]|uniref:hypothetical protein n=1 Tax=Coprococcus eutactus TaxID=33043 RepID=UPI001C014C62|nr:hypothetical protein [Coprococcus eutactus]MBT9732824.1 hypothetical protein [Coprococcus eutactus]
MGFIYSSLNKCDSESWSQFDNRITRMLPFVTGMAYFDLRNYDVRTGEFGAYAEWDRELESLLGYELPDGGYFVKATIAQAYRLHGLGCGLPVYMKLISLNGKLYPYRTYVMMEGRPYSLEFGGGELMPIDDRYVELGCAAAKETQLEAVSAGTGSKRFMRNGSQRLTLGGSQRFALGSSQRFALGGSQRFAWNGSQMRRLFGSQGGFRYLMGSQYRTVGSSQRFAWNGSQMRRLFGSQGGFRYLMGSQYRTVGGSQRFVLGSSRRFSMAARDNAPCQVQNAIDSTRVSQELLMEFSQEWQLINKCRRPEKRIGENAKFGYGLDLI